MPRQAKLALRAAVASCTLAIASISFVATQAVAQSSEFKPQVGQQGKDVVWVPTPEQLVERMLTMAQVTPRDVVIDLGSGDGRTVIAAAKKGAQAMGIEYNPDMVALSQKNAQAAGVSDKAQFMKADIFESDYSRASVITMYLLPGLNMKLRPKLLDMKPGTRLVSHQFTMEDWQPDETSYLDFRPAYLWIVPAKIGGAWAITLPGAGGPLTLNLEQTFQKLRGTVDMPPVRVGLREPRLWGDQIWFALVDQQGATHEFSGRVSGDTIQGAVVSGGTSREWRATRKSGA